jgi:hypothetical protein
MQTRIGAAVEKLEEALVSLTKSLGERREY